MSKERPILFIGPMVRAILDGRKTQTRRVVKLDNAYHECGHHEILEFREQNGKWFGLYEYNTVASLVCPYGQPGDRLWVRETYRKTCDNKSFGCVQYKSDESIRFMICDQNGEGDPIGTKPHKEPFQRVDKKGPPWIPSIHMPRWASRITLEITGVRVERLQDISPTDACKEGIFEDGNYCSEPPLPYPVATFKKLWNSINCPDSWDANPWVWVIEFKRVQP
jgi:hypothetical protein